MSRRQRMVVAAVAVLVAAAFVAAVLNPGSAGDSGPVAWLGRWVGDAAGAAPRDLDPDCQQPDGSLVFGDSCTIQVASAAANLRLVTLAAEHPVRVTAPAPAGGWTVATDVAAGDLVRVAVGADGAGIDLACQNDGDDCVVRIGAGDDG
jgi:hypothetical protein